MADGKAPNLTGSVTRSQARKRGITVGQKDEENDEGFHFSRRSKRIRQKDGQVQAKESEVKKSADALKKAKRRRSSFIRGRKIQSPLEICQSERLANVQGLYKEIPMNLSPDERLLMLFDKSLLVMCEVAKDMDFSDFSKEGTDDNDDAEEVKKFSVEEIIAHLRTSLQDSYFANRAKVKEIKTNERILIPNPKAQQLDEFAQKSQETTERMLKEDKEWEEILEKYQQKNETTESGILSSYKEMNRDFSVSLEQKELLDNVKPREGMLEELQRLKSGTVLLVDKIATTAKTVKALHDATEDYLDARTKELIELPTAMGVCETPRHLIHAITKDLNDVEM